MVEASKNANRIIIYEKAKSIGFLLLGVSAVFISVSMIFLVKQNEELDNRLECRAQAREHLDAAVGRGLVAVARGDDGELLNQGQLVLKAVDELEECENG